MFTAKDLEVYKDALKEKKNKPTKTGEKPLETPPSVAKISKPPLKLQNEEPIKERKPLSVVHKASNTIKDPHKPPSPIPVGTSKQTNPGLKPKTKEIKSRSPSPGLRTEANSFVKASSDIVEKRIPQSPRDTSLLKSSHIKLDDNKVSGGRRLKEPSTPKTSNGALQKASSFSGGKVAPAANMNPSLCSECTRAASEGAVCFIGNDGRVSACTTRSAVRLCKNLNCAANNPEYVAAMANAPKKYLISRRHSLKAQYGFKSNSGRSKSPNLEQTGSGSIDEWHHSGDTHSPLPGDIDLSNGGHADLSSECLGLECEDGTLSPMTDNLRLFDGDTSLLDGHDAFCDGEMGLTNDVIRDTACGGGYEAAEQSIGEGKDVIDEKNELSFQEGEEGKDVINEQDELSFQEGKEGKDVINEQNELSFQEDKIAEIESSKISSLESSTGHVEALAESDGYDATHPDADANSSELANTEELEDVDARGSSTLKGNETGMATTKDHEDMLQSGDGEQVGAKAQSGDVDSMVGVSQEEDENQNANVVSAIDNSQLTDDVQTGSKFESNDIAYDGQIGSKTSTNDSNIVTDDSNQVMDDITFVTMTGQRVQDGAEGGDPTPIEIGQVEDDGDSTSITDTNVAHDHQSGGRESNEDDGHNDVKGSRKSILNEHVADTGYGNDIPELDGGDAGDEVPLVNDAPSAIVTSSDGKHIADDDQGDVSTLRNDQHGADDGRFDILTSPHGMRVGDGNVIASPHNTQVADKGDVVPSPQGKHIANNEESNETELLDGKHSLEGCPSHDLTPTNAGHGADDEESDEDDDNGGSDEVDMNLCAADDSSPLDSEKSLDSTKKNTTIEGEDGSSSSTKKGSKQRRRRVLNVCEESNPEKVILRKQQTQERKQADEWMANYAIEGVVHKLAPTREGKVKILVEAFEAIISHTDAPSIDTHNASKEKHIIA